MPSSYPHNIPTLLAHMLAYRPHSIYEVGCGYGKWGVLLREYLDDYRGRLRIDGCEVFQPYIDRSAARHVYDTIQVGNWLEVTPPNARYDLVLMIDVLEHFNVDDATRALDKALAIAPGVLVSTPLNFPQGAINGNEYERHRSEWRPEDFVDHGYAFTDAASHELSTIGFVSATKAGVR